MKKGQQTSLLDDPTRVVPAKHLAPRPEFGPVATWKIADIIHDGGPIDEAMVAELVASIPETGLLQPIAIDSQHRIVFGRNRLEAYRRLGYKEIPARIIDLDEVRREIAVIDENLVRKHHTVLELGRLLSRQKKAYERLHPETRHHVRGGKARTNDADAETALAPTYTTTAAAKVGVSTRTAQDLIRIGELNDEVYSKLAGTLVQEQFTTLLDLAKAPPEQQTAIAEKLADDAKRKVRSIQRELEGGSSSSVATAHDDDAIKAVERVAKKTAAALVALSANAKRKVPTWTALNEALEAFLTECTRRQTSGVVEAGSPKKNAGKTKRRGKRSPASKASKRSTS